MYIIDMIEDYLCRRVSQDGTDWTWSALRPNPVCGISRGSFMNLTTTIAVYATLCRELGIELRFPGTDTAFHEVMEVCHAQVLADAMVFLSTSPNAANQAYNISNGDVFRWDQIWPEIGKWFGVETGPPLKVDLAMVMKGHAATWQKLAEKHGLAEHDLNAIATPVFLQFVGMMGCGGWFSNTQKLQRAGFRGMTVDTKDMFLRQFQELRDAKLIPPA
jgi:nucleoside-diphosphate-sugar epimerase